MTLLAANTRPPAEAWHTAAWERPCPTCGQLIRRGDPVAHINDGQARHVCTSCTSTRRPSKARTR